MTEGSVLANRSAREQFRGESIGKEVREAIWIPQEEIGLEAVGRRRSRSTLSLPSNVDCEKSGWGVVSNEVGNMGDAISCSHRCFSLSRSDLE